VEALAEAAQAAGKKGNNLNNNMPNQELTRINKFLSEMGYCSRREADKLIEQHKVKINGKPAQLGDKVTTKDKIEISGKKILTTRKPKKIYIAMNKPYGVITTTDRSKPNNILDYIDIPEKVFPIGRLDVQSTGLILLTNDGAIVNKLMRTENKVEKEYIVAIDKPIKPEDIKKLEEGIKLKETKNTPETTTLPAKVKKINPKQISITIVQGLNRQVRRMMEVLGYEVKILKRDRIGTIRLEELGRGKWRFLTDSEIKSLTT